MDGLRKDIRFALRLFARNRAFATIAVVTIALGIGANTAIFSVVRAVLLRPLPYSEPDRLVMIWGEMRSRNIYDFPSSPPDLQDMDEQATLFDEVAGVFSFQTSISDDAADPDRIEVGAVTPGFHAMLGVQPLVGRLLTADDATPAPPPPPDLDPAAAAAQQPPVMLLLSHALWQRRYGSDAGVVGRSVETGLGSGIVVGVLPPGLRLHLPVTAAVTADIDAWFAPRIDYATAPRNNVSFRVVGRMKRGVQLAQAQAEMSAIAVRLAETDEVKAGAGYGLRVVPLQEDLTAEVRPIVLALLGAVGFVLLIACANVSNLLLVRAASRDREMAVRSALGGSRFRIVRQMLAESAMLATLGAVLGVGLAALGIRVLLALQPGNLPRIDTVAIDVQVLAYTALAAVFAALVFGTLPALHASRLDLGSSLKERGRAASARANAFVRGGVVVLEVALSLVLLIGAGLMLRSFGALRDIDPGFDASNVLTFATNLPQTRYPTAESRALFNRQFRERLAGLPGVVSVSAATPLPLSQQMFNGPYGTEAALTDPQQFRQADIRVVMPEYFQTMRTRVIEGRALTEADEADSAAVIVVDRVLAERTWPGESAVGKRLLTRLFTPDPIWLDVVGVVDHQRHGTLAAEGREAIYYPDRLTGSFGISTWVMRTTDDPLTLVAPARAELEALDPLLPMADVRPLEDYVDRAMGSTRFALVLIGIFGIIALILSAVGLFGVLSYAVRLRTAEIGVRMAFGAQPSTILGMVVKQALGLTALGVLFGLIGAAALTRVLASQLVGVEPTDPATFATVAATFVTIAALASYLPARRATHVDPLDALRGE
jgi:putative ABC transport system permease protein